MKIREKKNLIVVEGFDSFSEEDINKLSEIVSQNSVICVLPTKLDWASKTNYIPDSYRIKDFILICRLNTG